MSHFVTVDLNGWLDHLVEEGEEVRTLGFRSCLYRHEDTWLFGAQALAAARDARSDEPLTDVIDALASAAGHGTPPPMEREALPAALWQLAADATRRSDSPVHLAIVVPDGRFLGAVKVRKDTGRTALEALYYELERARPRALTRSRIELVWRSVAALRAVLDQGKLGDEPGAVLVISVNRRTFWTVLKLRSWFRSGQSEGPLRIVRSSGMDDCDESEAWTARRAEAVRHALTDQGVGDLEAIQRWTRRVEILASGIQPESLQKLGMDADAIEHRSWPMPNDTWGLCPHTPAIKWTANPLPTGLKRRIECFRGGAEGVPLAIVVESPVGVEMTAGFERSVREIAAGIPIYRATGADTARAAANLAQVLGRDPEAPAWLDEVPGIEIEVRKTASESAKEIETEWRMMVPGNEAVPAGETYHTRSEEDRHVTLAPGIEHVHLHLRRGRDGAWDERYSGRDTGHLIRPSDHVRIVEPLARVRPLSGETRIEIVEHLPDGRAEALAGSRAGMRWSEMGETPPLALRSIPELYLFKPAQKGWNDLKDLLRRVVENSEKKEGIGLKLKNELYQCTQRQWKERKFPLGSDGEPPRDSDPRKHRNSRRLLGEATAALLRDLERSIQSGENLREKAANRLHLPLTWLFTGCPERTVEILLDTIVKPECKAGRVLHMDNDYSAWSIYSGLGRAARSEETVKTIFDTLIGEWEDEGGRRQDKFLLAAVTHPMARRVAVRRVLNESRERFDRVKRFLDQHLENILRGTHDPRPGRKEPNLELRYVTMGYRGLCQVRYTNPDWLPVVGEDARANYERLRQARGIGKTFEQNLIDRTAPYLIGEGVDPSIPGGF